jgi:hypothetical protein
VLAAEPADAAAQRQAGDAGLRHHAERRRQAELLRRAIELAERDPRLGAGHAGLRIDRNALHRRQVDDNRVVRERVARHAVAAAADRDPEAVFAGEGDCRDDVRGRRAAHDHRRLLVDHPVPESARLLVAVVAARDDNAGEAFDFG